MDLDTNTWELIVDRLSTEICCAILRADDGVWFMTFCLICRYTQTFCSVKSKCHDTAVFAPDLMNRETIYRHRTGAHENITHFIQTKPARTWSSCWCFKWAPVSSSWGLRAKVSALLKLIWVQWLSMDLQKLVPSWLWQLVESRLRTHWWINRISESWNWTYCGFYLKRSKLKAREDIYTK